MLWRSVMAPLLALLALPVMADLASAQDRGRDRGPPGFDRDRGPPPGYDRGPPQREQWDLLGEQSVGFGVDRDVIRVGRREGRFSALALEVRDNDVEILDLKVFFDRGPPQDVRVRQVLRSGDRTRPIPFAWGDRRIDRIEIVYRSRPSFRGRAKVAIFGLRDMPPPPPPPPPVARWEELGCGKVGIKPDRDTIRVGRREGRFSTIKLIVRGSKIELIDLTVVYDRGPPDQLSVRKKIGDGDETPPLDLRGERRIIDHVDLTYRQTLGLNMIKGPATVCVLGR
jgi:hypothetical protein